MEEVYLWLGANVMLAYPLDEAEAMLHEKLSAAESSLGNCEEDLEFLREQITVRTEELYSKLNQRCQCRVLMTLCRRLRLLRRVFIIGM